MNESPEHPWRKWGLGIAAACALTGYAVSIFVSGEAVIRRRHGVRLELYGLNAVLIGLAVVAMALALHAHFFWGESQRLAMYADWIKILAALLFIGCLGAVIVHVLLFA